MVNFKITGMDGFKICNGDTGEVVGEINNISEIPIINSATVNQPLFNGLHHAYSMQTTLYAKCSISDYGRYVLMGIDYTPKEVQFSNCHKKKRVRKKYVKKILHKNMCEKKQVMR